MGFPATPRGMTRRDGEEEEEDEEGAGEDADAAEGEEEEEAAEAAAAAAAAAEAPLLFLDETVEAAFIFGLRRTGTCDFGVFSWIRREGRGVEKVNRGRRRKQGGKRRRERANGRKKRRKKRRRMRAQCAEPRLAIRVPGDTRWTMTMS